MAQGGATADAAGGRLDTNPGDFWSQNAPPVAPPAAQPNMYGTTAPAGGMTIQSAAGGANLPQFTAGMTDDQVRAAANAYIAAGGGPNTDNGEYWVQAYKQFGSDPNYFRTKLLNGIHGAGGNMAAFGPPDPQAPGGWGPDTTGYGGGGAGGGGGVNSYAPGAGAGGFGSFSGGPDAFVPPTGLTEANDPGYMARLKMGTDSLQGAAAAKGSLLGGGTLKALDRYTQDYASNEFGNVYGRALTGYNTNVGTQRNAMNDYWSRLQGLYQGGQQATGGTPQPPPAQ